MNISGNGNSGLGDNLTRLTKEPPMLVLTERKDVATINGENTESTMALVSVNRMRPKITPPMLQRIISKPPARIVKILEIRERLALGIYDIDKRLDAVLDRILADIKT
jgi:hypothetical protein